jgi:hypothetical protein
MAGTRKSFYRSLGIVSVIVIGTAIAVLTGHPYRLCVRLAAAELFRPSTTELMPLPLDCVETRDAVSQDMLTIIELQRAAYDLSLQNVRTCRSSSRFPQGEPEFSERAFTEEVRRKWLPAYVGCCTYSFRRHFAVVAAKSDGEGAQIVVATLVESRWNYLRFLRWHCDEKLKAWL